MTYCSEEEEISEVSLHPTKEGIEVKFVYNNTKNPTLLNGITKKMLISSDTFKFWIYNNLAKEGEYNKLGEELWRVTEIRIPPNEYLYDCPIDDVLFKVDRAKVRSAVAAKYGKIYFE